MKILLGKQQINYLNPLLILFVFFSVIIFWHASDLYSKSHGLPKNDDKISFEDRLAFYLDQKSKTFLTDMAVNEKLLLQMIQNITRELKARGKTAKIDKEIGRPELYSNADTLIAEYSNELNSLLEIIAEITQLEKVVEQHNDVSAWESLAALREKVIRLLDNRNLHLYGTSGNIQHHASTLLKDYYAEIDSVLDLYRSLSQLEETARTEGDYQILKEIAVQKELINDLLGNLSPSTTDSLADNYLHETKLLINILKELEDLQSQAFQQNSELSFEIEDFRRSLLMNLDKRLLSLMGYHSSLPINGPNVSEIFKEWIANQYVNYEIQFTQYQLMKKSLLQNATEAQCARMLEMDLENAYLNYVGQNFKLAQKQFDLLIQDYGESFESFATVLFYRAESFFIRYLYDEAAQDYKRIVSEFPVSEYFGESLFRLMLISEKMGKTAEFSEYFDMLESQSDNIEKDCFDKSSYLAGYVNIKNSNFTVAQEILSRVSNDSKYYLMARYLLGIVFVNQQNYANAIEIFKDLAGLKKNLLPGSVESFVRNNALLKLGFIYYEKDD
ncbi:MAG: tol-pal system YbgF family protein, partial [bacterium]